MKKAIVLVALWLCADIRALSAACRTAQCERAVAWKSGYAAIVLQSDVNRRDYFAVLAAVKANGGAVAIETEDVILGWLPLRAVAKLRATRGVRAVSYDRVTTPQDGHSVDAVNALGFFNRVVSGEYEDLVEAGLATEAEPLTGCVVTRSTSSATLKAEATEFAGAVDPSDRVSEASSEECVDSTGGNRGEFGRVAEQIAPAFWFRQPYRNPDMRGRVTVQFFTLDSDGRVDPNLYTWPVEHYRIVRDQVFGAFTFWANQAATRGITLSFRVKTEDPISRYTRTSVPTATKYEPVTRGIEDDYLWMNDALSRVGYGSTVLTRENVYTKNEAFNEARRADTVYGPFDRTFSVYVAYNPDPAIETFADGYRAYATWDGPLVMLLWNSGGWGPENLGRVLTHETGHIFWACDEYYDEPSNTGCTTCDHCFYSVGPRNRVATPWIKNANCAYGTFGCRIPQAACVMNDVEDAALCPDTPAQIGW